MDVFFLENNLVKNYQQSLGAASHRNVLVVAEQKSHLSRMTALLEAVVALFIDVRSEAYSKGDTIKIALSQFVPNAVSTVLGEDAGADAGKLAIQEKCMAASKNVLTRYEKVMDYYSDARGVQLQDLLKGQADAALVSGFLVWLKDKLIPAYTDTYAQRRVCGQQDVEAS